MSAAAIVRLRSSRQVSCLAVLSILWILSVCPIFAESPVAPAHAFSAAPKCGLVALSRLAGARTIAADGNPESLSELERIADEAGLGLRMARRADAGAALPVPAIVHWRLGHFSAVTASEANRHRFDDPALGETPVWLDREQVEGLASGYFLIPAESGLPPGWREVSPEEGATVRGGHFLTPKPGSVGPGNTKAKKKDCDEVPGEKPPSECGMADWDIALMMASLEVADTPLGYRPPFGPEVFFNLQYNERDSNQPPFPSYANFGPLWSCDWIGSLTFQGTSAFFNRGQGGIETFTGFDEGTQSYQPSYQFWHRLVRVDATRYELSYADGSKLVFALPDNPASPTRLLMTQVVDPQGNAATISYDGSFRVTGVADALGRASAFTYGTGAEALLVKKITDPFGRFATFDYDGAGRLIRIADAIGLTSEFTYDGGNRMLTMVTGYGATSFAYGTVPGSRWVEVTHPNGDKERVEQRNDTTPGVPATDPADLVPSGSYANFLLDHWNSFHWDRKAYAEAAGDYTRARHYHFLRELAGVQTPVLESVKVPGENRVWFSYQGQGEGFANVAGPGVMGHSPSAVARVLDDGSTQKFLTSYNALGNPLSETDPAGRELTYSYAANGIDVVEVRQKTGTASSVRLMTATYDHRHLPLTVTDTAGGVSTFTWNARGQMTSRTDALGQTTVLNYDASGFLVSADLPLPGSADSISFTYDGNGRARTLTDVDGYTLTYDYDALDRVTRFTFPDGTFEETTWLWLHVSASRDRLGRITSYARNSSRQLESVTDPLSRTTRYEWCKCGDLKAIVDPLGRRTSWSHDVAGRVTAKTFPDGSAETYGYDLAGRLTTVTDAKGQTKTLSRDAANLLTGVSYQGALVPTPSVAVAYDPWFDRPVSRTDGTGATFLAYHAITGLPAPGAGMLASVDGPMPDDTIEYRYDALGRVTSRDIGGIAATRSYDALGRLAGTTNALGAFAFAYAGATARPLSVNLPGGWQTLFEYFDNLGDRRLKTIRHLRPDANPLARHDYTHDAHGRLLGWSRQDDSAPSVPFTAGYDLADRLTSFTAPGWNFAYSYDGADNRLTETDNAGTATAAYNPLNEFASRDAPSPPPAKAFTWDAEDRLVAIDYTGTNLRSEFLYDGASRCVRIVEKDGATVTGDRRYLWDGLDRVEERDAAGTVLRRFFELGETVGGTPLYYFRDHLGSVRDVADNAAARARYSFDPWGCRVRTSGDVETPVGYTGHFTHEPSGLVLAPYRAYDPELGRWASRDPMGEPAGLNLFAYCDNAPLTLVDPTGADAVQFYDNGMHTKTAIGRPGDWWIYDFGPEYRDCEGKPLPTEKVQEIFNKILAGNDVKGVWVPPQHVTDLPLNYFHLPYDSTHGNVVGFAIYSREQDALAKQALDRASRENKDPYNVYNKSCQLAPSQALLEQGLAAPLDPGQAIQTTLLGTKR